MKRIKRFIILAMKKKFKIKSPVSDTVGSSQQRRERRGGTMNGVKIFLELENSERPELKFDKKYSIKVIETGEDYRTERWYLNVEIESVDSYFIMLKRLNYNSKQDPYPKVAISKIVEVDEVE